MRFPRTLVLTTLVLGFGAAVASSQSLAEVAKKEKERRAKNDTESPRAVTDRELASTFGVLPPASSTVQTRSSGEASAGAATEGERGDTPVQDVKETQEYWQNRVKAAKEKIAKAEEQLQSDDWGDGLRMGINPQGVVNLNNRQREEQQGADARSELEAIRAEGRKTGVPPGWLR